MLVSAKDELVLRCGKASITLTRAGKVLIQGSYVSSRSTGVNRVKGVARCTGTEREGRRVELLNATRMVAGFNLGVEQSGRELLVVVAKGTFRIPPPDAPDSIALHETQLPLVMADTFTGAPGLSAPVYEVDFAPRKPRCDILLLGSAYAPRGRPAARVEVGLRVGNWSKTFAVVGPRQWECGLAGVGATPPGVFVRQPVSYDGAFGGTDLMHEDPGQHAAFMANPVGRGFHRHIAGGVGRRPAAACSRKKSTVPCAAPTATTGRWPSAGRARMGPALSLCRHLRPGVAGEALSFPAARFRRTVFPGSAARPAGAARSFPPTARSRCCWPT